GSAERERRAHVGKKYAESLESLSSAITSPSTNDRFRYHYPNTGQERQCTTSRAKLSTSYASAYNPFSSESSVTAPNLFPTNASSGHRKMSLLSMSKYQLPELSRPSKNISLPDNRNEAPDIVRGDIGVCVGTATDAEILLSELRMPEAFIYRSDWLTDTYELLEEPPWYYYDVYESKEDGWLIGTLNGKTGLIPANYVEPLP
ncbi:unnamed protein product, partial [Litomosoides sigmodontis]